MMADSSPQMPQEQAISSALLDLVSEGIPLDKSIIITIKRLLKAHQHVVALAAAQSIASQSTTRRVGMLAVAIIGVKLRRDDLAWQSFGEVPQELIAELVPGEYALAAAYSNPVALDAFEHKVMECLASYDAETCVQVVQGFLAGHRPRSALRIGSEVAGRVKGDETLSTKRKKDFDWFMKWADREASPLDVEEIAEGTDLVFGIMGYKAPERDRSSSNLGDYVQTIAATSHLVRRKGLEFSGNDDLVSAAEMLTSRVPQERRVGGPEKKRVHLVEMNRDASTFDPVPSNTWALAFGWYAHNIFGMGRDFPFHKNINPIFISFHVNRLDMLTDEAIDYLRVHAPIGCRDWNTVYLLLSADIPAFFSGCLTTTVGALFPQEFADPDKPEVYVDTKAPEGVEWITQAYDGVREQSIGENISDAVHLIEKYQTNYSRVVTSRLHCYLPAWACGVNVEFQPHNPADIRFNGLLDATEEDRVAMRDRITRLLDQVLATLLDGASKHEVYDAWSRICSDEVQRARERFAVKQPLSELPFAIEDVVTTVRNSTRHDAATVAREGEPVHVAIAMDGNLKEQAKVVIEGLVENTRRPLHLYVLCRDHTSGDMNEVAHLFPEVDLTWMPCDGIYYGDIAGMLAHITVSTMDRLLLPYLLEDLNKVVYHDIDALTIGDIGELYDHDLGESPLAARDAVGRNQVLGFQSVWAHRNRLLGRPDISNDFLLRMAQHLKFDFRSFNAGIMVLNLQVMRDDKFADRFLPWATMYGLNDEQLLNCYAGNTRTPLGPEWNALPARDPWRLIETAKTVHWLGPTKPWSATYIYQQELWSEYKLSTDERQRSLSKLSRQKS